MKFKISKSKRKKYFGTNCLFAVFFHFTAHFVLLIAHFLLLIANFLGKPECIPPHLERFPAQQGVEKQVGLRWLFCKKQNSWASHFQKGKKQTGLVMC
jgi:hypothetical protein